MRDKQYTQFLWLDNKKFWEEPLLPSKEEEKGGIKEEPER